MQQLFQKISVSLSKQIRLMFYRPLKQEFFQYFMGLRHLNIAPYKKDISRRW